MKKFCTECGKEIATGVAFCTECGAKAPADPAPDVTETVTEAVETKVETPVVHTPPAQTYQAQQQTQPVYQQPPAAPATPDSTSKALGTGAYFGLMFLFALPIIGILSAIIMSFVAKNKNVKHFAKANFIWSIIAFVLFIAAIIVIIALGNSLLEYVKQVLEDSFGDLLMS